MENLSLLGNNTKYEFSYKKDILEKFSNKHEDIDSFIELVVNEFTSLCPITNQPDFAKIFINYIPDKYLVESKSLKLYLFSFRNHGSFHEDCINIILKDIKELLDPKYIEVKGLFTPRGGISINPFVNYANVKYNDLKKQRLLMSNNIGK